jgi:hypothetical protein
MTFGTPVSLFRSLARRSSTDADRRIREWRVNWQLGAQAGWADRGPDTNPNRAGSDAFAAWTAGWAWATRHPDRRGRGQSGLAHPYRRSSDTLLRLLRHSGHGAIGLSAITVLGGLWAMRRRRTHHNSAA